MAEPSMNRKARHATAQNGQNQPLNEVEVLKMYIIEMAEDKLYNLYDLTSIW